MLRKKAKKKGYRYLTKEGWYKRVVEAGIIKPQFEYEKKYYNTKPIKSFGRIKAGLALDDVRAYIKDLYSLAYTEMNTITGINRYREATNYMDEKDAEINYNLPKTHFYEDYQSLLWSLDDMVGDELVSKYYKEILDEIQVQDEKGQVTEYKDMVQHLTNFILGVSEGDNLNEAQFFDDYIEPESYDPSLEDWEGLEELEKAELDKVNEREKVTPKKAKRRGGRKPHAHFKKIDKMEKELNKNKKKSTKSTLEEQLIAGLYRQK